MNFLMLIGGTTIPTNFPQRSLPPRENKIFNLNSGGCHIHFRHRYVGR